jgi:nucleotide-binding universal stress UspA family protein
MVRERMSRNLFSRVAVAFDGSPDSVKAVKTACAIARDHGAELTVVHVCSVPIFAYAVPAPVPQIDVTAMERSVREAGLKVLEKARRLADEGGVRARTELLESGSVVQAIVEFAANEKCDLVVVGTRGTTGFRKLVLGSVSSGVVSHAPCPVLVVR